MRGLPEWERRENTLIGMCAAMGALFPTPVLGVMLMAELAERQDVSPCCSSTEPALKLALSN